MFKLKPFVLSISIFLLLFTACSNSNTQEADEVKVSSAYTALSALGPGKAVLSSGPKQQDNLPWIDGVSCLYGEYTYMKKASFEAVIHIPVWYSMQAVDTKDWDKGPSLKLPQGWQLRIQKSSYSELWAMISPNYSLFVSLPKDFKQKELFASQFASRFEYFYKATEYKSDISFPSILDIE